MIYFEICLFNEIVSFFTQNGKVTVNGSIIRSFDVFHRCVAASNQCHACVVYSSSCPSIYKNIKIHLYLQKLLVGCTQNKV